MEKLKLDLDAVTVESFDAGSTTLEHDRATRIPCSAIDACPSARGCSIVVGC